MEKNSSLTINMKLHSTGLQLQDASLAISPMSQQSLYLGLPFSSLGSAPFPFLCITRKEDFKQLPKRFVISIVGLLPRDPCHPPETCFVVFYTQKSSVLPLQSWRSVAHPHWDVLVLLNGLPGAVLTLEEEEGGLESPRSVWKQHRLQPLTHTWTYLMRSLSDRKE